MAINVSRESPLPRLRNPEDLLRWADQLVDEIWKRLLVIQAKLEDHETRITALEP